jgi:hypothetical protein
LVLQFDEVKVIDAGENVKSELALVKFIVTFPTGATDNFIPHVAVLAPTVSEIITGETVGTINGTSSSITLMVIVWVKPEKGVIDGYAADPLV